jgi:GT2 family glycosyltransferase
MKYYHPRGSGSATGDGYRLGSPQGGWVAVDEALSQLWRVAHQRSLSEIADELGEASPIPSHLLQPSLEVLRAAGLLGPEFVRPIVSVETLTNDAEMPHPLVSVIIVNRNGRSHLEDCLESLARQTYEPLEVIVADNGSTDDSVSFIKTHYPETEILELGENLGFSVANNHGIAVAKGDWLFLLNNDTVLEPSCISELMRAQAGQARVAAIVPKMRFWALPAFINSIGNHVGPRSWGSDNFIGYLDLGQFDGVQEVPSACFGAALLSRDALEVIGLLDPAYFFYYEDADWSYRARAQGHRILAAPCAVLYHKFGASMRTLETGFKLGLVVQNRLRYAMKNLSCKGAWQFLRNYAFEDLAGLAGAIYRRNWRSSGAYLRAWARFLISLPDVLSARKQVQRQRVMGDEAIFSLMQIPPPQMRGDMPLLTIESVERIYLPMLQNLSSLETQPSWAGGPGSLSKGK